MWILAPDPKSVPDGGTTVMLLGVALGSLGMARRLPEEVSSLKQFSDTRVAVPFGAATFFWYSLTK